MRFGRKATAAVMAGLMVTSSIVPAGIAFAVPNEPSSGEQTGTGQTDLTMVLQNGATEYGGTEDQNNPDVDNDHLGDNIAFTVPSAINYVVKADGTLTGPSSDVVYIDNESVFGINVSSVDVDAQPGFSIVEDVTESSGANAVDLLFGPEAEMVSAHDYLTKAAVPTPEEWSMSATVPGMAFGVGEIPGDHLPISSEGHVARLTADVTSQTKFGEIHWYVSPTVMHAETLSSFMMEGIDFNVAAQNMAEESFGTIRRIVTAKGTVDPDDVEVVSYGSSDGEGAVYMSFDVQTGTLTLTSQADRILLSSDSHGMFSNMTDLEYVDIRAFKFPNGSDLEFSGMFRGCSNLTTIEGIEDFMKSDEPVDGWFDAMFEGCSNLVADCSGWQLVRDEFDNVSPAGFNRNAPGVVSPEWVIRLSELPGSGGEE